jgi:hypothetical protein
MVSKRGADEAKEIAVADRLRSLDLIHLQVEGAPAHVLGLVDGVPEPAVRSETDRSYGVPKAA